MDWCFKEKEKAELEVISQTRAELIEFKQAKLQRQARKINQEQQNLQNEELL